MFKSRFISAHPSSLGYCEFTALLWEWKSEYTVNLTQTIFSNLAKSHLATLPSPHAELMTGDPRGHHTATVWHQNNSLAIRAKQSNAVLHFERLYARLRLIDWRVLGNIAQKVMCDIFFFFVYAQKNHFKSDSIDAKLSVSPTMFSVPGSSLLLLCEGTEGQDHELPTFQPLGERQLFSELNPDGAFALFLCQSTFWSVEGALCSP